MTAENTAKVKRGKKSRIAYIHNHIMFRPKRTQRVDFLLFILVMTLLLFGLIMLFSASQNTSEDNIYSVILKQGICAIVGGAAMFATSRLDYHVYKRFSPWLFWIVAAIMYVVPILGIASHGARRQISIGGLNFQPSEISKFVLVMYFAALLSGKRNSDLTKRKNVFRYVFYLGVLALACVFQSHLSALLLIVCVGLIMLFAAGLPWIYAAILGAFTAVGGALLAVLTPYRMKRLMIFLDPFSDKQDAGWQIVNSLYAVGSGGLLGLGFGQSRQKYDYLPEAQNDYIYAIVCEELGFVGGVAVLLLFALLIIRGMQISFSSKDLFGAYLGFGIITIIALQVLINVGVVLSVLPSTGMQLPFFSSGGTSLVIMMAGLGILMNISRFSTQNKI